MTASALHWYTKAKIKLLSLALHGMQDSNNQLHSCARKQRRSSARLTQEIEKETVCKKISNKIKNGRRTVCVTSPALHPTHPLLPHDLWFEPRQAEIQTSFTPHLPPHSPRSSERRRPPSPCRSVTLHTSMSCTTADQWLEINTALSGNSHRGRKGQRKTG